MYFHLPTFLTALKLAWTKRPFSSRHALLSVVFVAAFLVLRSVVLAFRGLDHLLYPGFRDQGLEKPLFIVGNPRSGSTFSHRLLVGDERYTWFKLWHTIFPAVSLYKLFGFLGDLDTRLGSPLARGVARLSKRGLQGWESMHETGPEEAESDEMLFVYAFTSPLIMLLFPYFDELTYCRLADSLPADARARLRDYWLDCLRRHVYATGGDRGEPKVLLEKVALIAGRLELVLEALPDARIVHLVRHPYESVPSLISMLSAPWPALAPQHADPRGPAVRGLSRMIFDYYRTLLRFKQTLPPEQFYEIRYEELLEDPRSAWLGMYAHFGIEVSEDFSQYLSREMARARQYKSRHRYALEDWGLSRAEIADGLKDVFEAYRFER